jgi:hypothetical protein
MAAACEADLILPRKEDNALKDWLGSPRRNQSESREWTYVVEACLYAYRMRFERRRVYKQ